MPPTAVTRCNARRPPKMDKVPAPNGRRRTPVRSPSRMRPTAAWSSPSAGRIAGTYSKAPPLLRLLQHQGRRVFALVEMPGMRIARAEHVDRDGAQRIGQPIERIALQHRTHEPGHRIPAIEPVQQPRRRQPIRGDRAHVGAQAAPARMIGWESIVMGLEIGVVRVLAEEGPRQGAHRFGRHRRLRRRRDEARNRADPFGAELLAAARDEGPRLGIIQSVDRIAPAIDEIGRRGIGEIRARSRPRS